MVIGRRVHPGWVSWKDLPGWLQGATYWACLNGGPLDTLDVVRLDTGLRTGASAREIFFREEPRWMVKTILLLQERGIIKEKFSTSEVHQAVALWWGLEEETIRRRCSGDMSLGKKGNDLFINLIYISSYFL